MSYSEDFKKHASKIQKCKSCISYDFKNENLKCELKYYKKVAICKHKSSGRYKVGHNTLCCEFYQESEVVE